jgi:hypothetical protein
VSAPRDLLAAALRRERGEELAAVRGLAGGANSEVWEVATAGGARYLAKRYPAPEPGGGDRLGTEYGAYAFLRGHGVLAVPEPVCSLPAERIAVYGFVPGERLAPGGVGADAVRQAAAFLGRLHALRGAAGAERLPVAKEACFSLAAHEALVRGRLVRLRGRPAAGDEADRGLDRYLETEFAPHLEAVASWAREGAALARLDPEAELGAAARTLSPSDFGFHNAIRRPDGELVFIDFEYFGWDDPAKTVADFFLQPAVPVPREQRLPFFRAVEGCYGPDLGRRLPLVHGLLSLKWCLIILNVFLRPGAPDPAARDRQLGRARAHLDRVRGEFATKAFPFGPE